ncbi:alcohol dehydrogenase catalytic domain-containing protein [Chloroflexi bacterium TSY]|nr:alcohol dehydrogenase catalytic domain-containing protein [Chloroflexi bacterium TSY]
MTTMLAGVFVGEGQLDIKERPIPSLLADDWVRIEVEGCGVCGTDLHILSVPPGYPGTPDTVLGHEFVGYVVDAGDDVTDTKIGDRVSVAANLTCGKCKYCLSGMTIHCEKWTTIGINIDGGFARYVVAPESSLHQVSKNLPFEEAVWIEPLSCVVNGTDRYRIQPGQTAVVIGAGPIGALHGMMLKAAGARVIISDLAQVRLDVAKKAGLDVAVNAGVEKLTDVVMDVTNGFGAEVVVDAVGNQFDAALDCTAKGGTISLFGLNEHAKPEIQQFAITRNDLTITGAFVGENTFPRAIQILESGVIKPSAMNSMTLPLPEIHAGIEAAQRGQAVKVIVQADSSF